MLSFFSFPDIVVSASALKVIFNNFMPELKEVWTIPILVRQHGSKTVIYVDKPLPPTSMTTDEKSNLRCKRSARIKMAQSWNRGNFKENKRHRSPKKKRQNVEGQNVEGQNVEDFFDETIDLSSLETFGFEESRPSVMQVKFLNIQNSKFWTFFGSNFKLLLQNAVQCACW